MRAGLGYAAVALFAVVVGAVAADRQWQTGTWTQVGTKRTPFVGDAASNRIPTGPNKPAMTQVATYVIETDDRRYQLQALVPIGSDRFDARVTVGHPVTFAVEKKTAYIKLEEGGEYRLLVFKNERKKTP